MAAIPVLSGRRADGFFQPHGGDLKTIADLLDLDSKTLLDFSANINPFGPPAEVLAAAAAAAESVADYPELNAGSFISALGARLDIKPDCLLPGNGSADLLYWLFAWLKPRRVLLIEPGFGDYRRAASRANKPASNKPPVGLFGRPTTTASTELSERSNPAGSSSKPSLSLR